MIINVEMPDLLRDIFYPFIYCHQQVTRALR